MKMPNYKENIYFKNKNYFPQTVVRNMLCHCGVGCETM